MDKLININFKINIFKWAINQPLSLPLTTLVCFELLIVGFVFNNWIFAILVSIITLSSFILFGCEIEGVYYYKKILNYLNYNNSKKHVLYSKQNKAIRNGVIVTNEDISTTNTVDVTMGTNNQLSHILFDGSDQLTYVVDTNLNQVGVDEVQQYLRGNISNVEASLLPALNSFVTDFENLIGQKEFKNIDNQLILSIKNVDPELEKIKTKTVLNEQKLIINKSNYNICLY